MLRQKWYADDGQQAHSQMDCISLVPSTACSPAADKGQLEADLLPPGRTDFAGVSPGLTVNPHHHMPDARCLRPLQCDMVTLAATDVLLQAPLPAICTQFCTSGPLTRIMCTRSSHHGASAALSSTSGYARTRQ